MAQLMNCLKKIGKPAEIASASGDYVEVEPGGHHQKRALRGWRVVLDKLATIIRYCDLKDTVDEWFPQSQPLHGSPSEAKEETLADIFSKIIKGAKSLNPLKSKDKPKVSISNCVHPKGQLRGGGIASKSYVTCKICSARWESPMTVASIKEYMKENKAQGGLLDQGEQTMEMESPDEWSFAPGELAELQNALAVEQQKNQRLERQIAEMRRSQLGRTAKAKPKSRPPTAPAHGQSAVVGRVMQAILNNEDYDSVQDGIQDPSVVMVPSDSDC